MGYDYSKYGDSTLDDESSPLGFVIPGGNIMTGDPAPVNLSTRNERLEERVKHLERRVDDLEAEVATLRNINRRRNY